MKVIPSKDKKYVKIISRDCSLENHYKETILSSRHFRSMQYALRKLSEFYHDNEIDSVYLYGSCAKGKARYSSDVDIFLSLKSEKINRRKMLKLKSEASPADSLLPEVDLHIYHQSSLEKPSGLYFQNVRKDGIQIELADIL